MIFICKLDRKLYSCISENIVSDEVIITEERVEHIKANHPNDYERYCEYLSLIITEPDYIIEDEHPNTALVLKEIQEGETGEYFRIALRLITTSDSIGFQNSVLTFWKTHKREYARIIRNKKVLYKSE